MAYKQLLTANKKPRPAQHPSSQPRVRLLYAAQPKTQMDRIKDYLHRFQLAPQIGQEAEEVYDLDTSRFSNRQTKTLNRPIFNRAHPMDRYASIGRGNWWNRTKAKMHPDKEQWTILTLISIMAIIITIGYQFRITEMMLFPFAIISTIFHEFGHAAMALLTGGRMHSITINFDESGATRFSGGHVCLILPAGYIGSTLMGSLLLFMGFGHETSRWAALGVIFILLVTIFFAGNLFAFFSSIILGAMLFIAFMYRGSLYTRHFVLFLGVICSMEAILSILKGTVFHTIKESDAYVFSQKCSFLLPSFIFGILWFIISLGLIALSISSALILFKRL